MNWDQTVATCAPNVAQVTIERIWAREGGNNPLALNVNKLRGPQPRASSPTQAALIARRYIAMGFSVDLGGMQINSRNLPAFGYTMDQIEAVFDVCTNLRIGSSILRGGYGRARASGYPAGQDALKVALSIYNTGNEVTGFLNGYVRGYYESVPALDSLQSPGGGAIVVPVRDRAPAALPSKPRNPYAADGQVWWRE